MVIDPGDPLEYERYLYTLEWVNSSPETGLESIEVCGDPNGTETLVVLGITALTAL
jgi:hypothetical protein